MTDHDYENRLKDYEMARHRWGEALVAAHEATTNEQRAQERMHEAARMLDAAREHSTGGTT